MNIEQAAALLGVAIPVIAGLDFLIRWYFDSHRKALKERGKHLEQRNGDLETRISELQQDIEVLQKKIQPPDWISPHAARVIGDLQRAHEEEQARANQAVTESGHGKKRCEELDAVVANTSMRLAEVSEERDRLQGDVEEYEKEMQARGRIVNRTLALEGRIWTGKVLHGAPTFISLPERRTPVVSVLNLKGGVGKTTLTAYLAWAMVRKGYRVLLIDLDLQGSLSSLFLSAGELAKRSEDGLVLRDFLAAAAAKEADAKLQNYTVPVARLEGKADLLATTDKLAYEELNLTFQWLFRIGLTQGQWSGKEDVRLFLRRAIHRRGLKKRYDLVLLDCPPMVNLCCVNALAASDYVMIPVTPSRKSLERVPPLLQRLKEIQAEVNPELGVMGVAANRTQQQPCLTPGELELWNELPQHCLDAFGSAIHRFEAFLPQRVLIRNAEDDFPPKDDTDIIARVDWLANEVESRLPAFCRPAETDSPSEEFKDAKEVSP
jgi:cellulose biosynthesis protein BcsQ/prefoldin subunit 5